MCTKEKRPLVAPSAKIILKKSNFRPPPSTLIRIFNANCFISIRRSAEKNSADLTKHSMNLVHKVLIRKYLSLAMFYVPKVPSFGFASFVVIHPNKLMLGKAILSCPSKIEIAIKNNFYSKYTSLCETK